MNPDDFVALGRITRTQGHQGAVRLQPYFEPLEEFEKLTDNEVFVSAPAPGSRAPSTPSPENLRTLHISGYSFHQQFLILEFEEIPDMTAAEALRGAEVYIPEDKLWQPEEGQFFVYEIEGFDLQDAQSGRRIGHIEAIESGPAHDFLKVRREKGTFLVPFARQFVQEISRDEKVIRVTLPEGLEEL